jgi:hypothetical protein
VAKAVVAQELKLVHLVVLAAVVLVIQTEQLLVVLVMLALILQVKAIMVEMVLALQRIDEPAEAVALLLQVMLEFQDKRVQVGQVALHLLLAHQLPEQVVVVVEHQVRELVAKVQAVMVAVVLVVIVQLQQ